MTSSRRQDPVRWRDRGADLHALESRAAALVDASKEAPALGPQALTRIRNRALAERRSGAGSFSDWLPRACDGRSEPRSFSCAGRPPVRPPCCGAGTSVSRTGRRPLPRSLSRDARRCDPSRQLSQSVPVSAARPPGPVVLAAPVAGAELGGELRRSPRRGVARASSDVPPPQVAASATNESPPLAGSAGRDAAGAATEARLVIEALSDLRQHDDPGAALAALIGTRTNSRTAFWRPRPCAPGSRRSSGSTIEDGAGPARRQGSGVFWRARCRSP